MDPESRQVRTEFFDLLNDEELTNFAESERNLIRKGEQIGDFPTCEATKNLFLVEEIRQERANKQ